MPGDSSRSVHLINKSDPKSPIDKEFRRNLCIFVISTVPSEGLTAFSAKTSACIDMTQCEYCMHIRDRYLKG